MEIAGFNSKIGKIAGEDCYLVNPKIGETEWDKSNLHLRSAMFNLDGEIISCGYKKFFNFHEKPDIDSWNHDWPTEATEKHDGSLLIISTYKGETIHRTRGTFNAESLANGHEIAFLKERYPDVFGANHDNASLLFEWETPNNKIVLDPPDEPTLTLIGGIHHHSCNYINREVLDCLAEIYGVKRPAKYSFETAKDALEDVKFWRGKEGIVLHSPNGQTLRKIKADEYLKAHYFLTQLNLNGILDMMELHCYPSREEFYEIVEKTCDFEILQWIKSDIDKVYAIRNEIEKLARDTFEFASGLNGDRKEKAAQVLNKYSDWRRAYAFACINGHPKIKNLKKILKNEYT